MVKEIDSLVSKYISVAVQSSKNQQIQAIQESITPTTKQQEIKKQIIPDSDLQQIAHDINKLITSKAISNLKVSMSYNKEINRIIITVIDPENNTILREIPCKELQNLALYLKEAVGVIFDKKA